MFLRFRPGTQREAPGLEPFGLVGFVANRSLVKSDIRALGLAFRNESEWGCRRLFAVLKGSLKENARREEAPIKKN